MASLTAPELLADSRFDEVALIEEARQVGRRRRRRRATLGLCAFVVAALIGVSIHQLVTSTAGAGGAGAARASIATCSHVHVKLLGTGAFPGAAVSAGILVDTAVSATTACRFDGYATLSAILGDGSSATASDLRSGLFGGFAPGGGAGAPLHSFKITSLPTTLSFTIEWVTGNGGDGCPAITGLRFTMPGSRDALVFRSAYEGGVSNTSFLGIYCRFLSVTPVVAGPTGRFHFGLAPPAVLGHRLAQPG